MPQDRIKTIQDGPKIAPRPPQSENMVLLCVCMHACADQVVVDCFPNRGLPLRILNGFQRGASEEKCRNCSTANQGSPGAARSRIWFPSRFSNQSNVLFFVLLKRTFSVGRANDSFAFAHPPYTDMSTNMNMNMNANMHPPYTDMNTNMSTNMNAHRVVIKALNPSVRLFCWDDFVVLCVVCYCVVVFFLLSLCCVVLCVVVLPCYYYVVLCIVHCVVMCCCVVCCELCCMLCVVLCVACCVLCCCLVCYVLCVVWCVVCGVWCCAPCCVLCIVCFVLCVVRRLLCWVLCVVVLCVVCCVVLRCVVLCWSFLEAKSCQNVTLRCFVLYCCSLYFSILFVIWRVVSSSHFVFFASFFDWFLVAFGIDFGFIFVGFCEPSWQQNRNKKRHDFSIDFGLLFETIFVSFLGKLRAKLAPTSDMTTSVYLDVYLCEPSFTAHRKSIRHRISISHKWYNLSGSFIAAHDDTSTSLKFT